jgi:hypothetical protein
MILLIIEPVMVTKPTIEKNVYSAKGTIGIENNGRTEVSLHRQPHKLESKLNLTPKILANNLKTAMSTSQRTLRYRYLLAVYGECDISLFR